MEQAIYERFEPAILREAARRYDVPDAALRALPAFESLIYEFERAGQPYILRLSHTLRRSVAMIQGEADWIDYLAAGGAGVARPIRSLGGELVEAIPDAHGGAFLATAFAKAPGRPPWEVGWSPALYERYGRLLGRMHSLARSYEPRPGTHRPAWNAPELEFVERYLPASEAAAKAAYAAVVAHLLTLPTDRAVYGMIHQDAHGGNFLVADDGALTLFDFDDCGWSWYANDIAIVLFYMAVNVPDPEGRVREFLPPFLRGYRTESALDARWLAEIPWFLKLREIELYGVIHRDFDVAAIDDPWIAQYMAGRADSIHRHLPVLDLDFGEFAADLDGPGQ